MKFGIPQDKYYQIAKTTTKNRGRHSTRELVGLSLTAIVVLLVATAIYYVFEWMTPARWVVMGSCVTTVALIYSLIRWRKLIFPKRERKAPHIEASHPVYTSIVPSMPEWQPLPPVDYPLWLMHRLYDLRFKRKMQRATYSINGKLWQYKIDIDQALPEPATMVGNIRVSRALRR